MKHGETFSGHINICGTFFNATVDKHICSIFPQYPFTEKGYSNPLPDKINELAELELLEGISGFTPKNFKSQFLDFITENELTNNSTKLLVAEMPKARYFLANKTSSYQFYAPIIIKPRPRATQPLDLSHFDAITFSGESVNLAYNPKFAVERTNDNEWYEQQKSNPGAVEIKIKPFTEYTRHFEVIIAGVKADLSYSITTNTEHMNSQNNKLGILNSFVRVAFLEKQPLEMIGKCYLQILHFLQFLLARQNVGFNIQLEHRVSSAANQHDGGQVLDHFDKLAEVFISDSYEDYCDVRLDHTIQLSHLEGDFPKLFNLFSENADNPFLAMLPASSKRVRYISYTDVGDICASLEREYKLKRYKAPKDDIRDALIKKLNHTISEYKEELAKTSPNNDYDKIISTASGNMRYIKLPLKECIIYLWEKSLDEVLDDVKKQDLKKDIADFVDMRNNITHEGTIVWFENHIVYIRLLRTLYYSILVRAGLSDENSKKIARQKFQRDDMLF